LLARPDTGVRAYGFVVSLGRCSLSGTMTFPV
jgi:hypothetical protein